MKQMMTMWAWLLYKEFDSLSMLILITAGAPLASQKKKKRKWALLLPIVYLFQSVQEWDAPVTLRLYNMTEKDNAPKEDLWRMAKSL